MSQHESGCSKRHTARQRCDAPKAKEIADTATATPVSTNAQRPPELFIDRGRVQSCLIALPILMPFIVIIVVFSGDLFSLVMAVIVTAAAFLVAAYGLLTVIDWVGKHV